jgi:conjugative relaxase-like TrwC/TraI family protein
MLSVHKITDAASASHYHSQKDDYYSSDSSASSRWSGSGARDLGLVNGAEVDLDEFNKMLSGRVDSDVQVGGEKHMPGYDLTFSSPKSVSVLALAGGDSRLVDAHEKAVAKALRIIEEKHIKTRIKKSGGEIEIMKTQSMIAAQFRHETSREQEAQLHSHCVVMNVTYDSVNKKYRSIDGRSLLNDKFIKSMGQEYRSALAEEVQKLGYEVRMTSVGSEGIGFEIEGVNEEYLEYMSSRSKQVEEYLSKKGLTRETASAAQKQEAVLATRKSKGAANHENLKQKWNEDALEHNVNLNHLINISIQNEEDFKEKFLTKSQEMANKSVAFAISKLEERSSSFTRDSLRYEAKNYGRLDTTDDAIDAAIVAAEKAQDIRFKYIRTWNFEKGVMEDMPAYASRLNIETEEAMLKHAESMSLKGKQLMNEGDARALVESISSSEKEAGRYEFNEQQIDATTNILNSKSSLNILQGLAGTSKTNSVLLTLSNEFKKEGYEVVGLAPTGAAKTTLSEALNINGKTLQSYLQQKQEARTGKGRVVILDEASLASAKEMKKLLEISDKMNDRVILTGDVNQLSSVESGNAFRQLQEAGHKTEKLEIIVRQAGNKQLLQGVYDAKDGKIAESIASVKTVELEKSEQRLAAMRDKYIELSVDERSKTLMLVTGKEDNQQLNDLVRSQLVARGELGDESIEFDVFKKRDITNTESKEARFYKTTDHVEFNKGYKKLAVESGQTAQVISIDENKNLLKVRFEGGREVEFNPKHLTKFSVLEKDKIDLRVGDKVIRTANADMDLEEKNGNEFHVMEIDSKNNTVTFEENGGLKTVSVEKLKRISHDYAKTTFPAQGKTYDRIYALAESYRVNLVNKTSYYVQISRAKSDATFFTDNKSELIKAVSARDGYKQTALEGLNSNFKEDSVDLSKEFKDDGKNSLLNKANTYEEFTLINSLNKAESAYLKQAEEVKSLEKQLKLLKRENEQKSRTHNKNEAKERFELKDQNLELIQYHKSIGYISEKEARKQTKEVYKNSRDDSKKYKGQLGDKINETLLATKLSKEKIKLKAMEVSLVHSQENRKARELINDAKSPSKKVEHTPPELEDVNDRLEREWEKVNKLKRAESSAEYQRLKLYRMSIANSNAKEIPKFRGANKSKNPLKRMKYNAINRKHNALVLEMKVKRVVSQFKLAYNAHKLNVMNFKLKNSSSYKEARELREKAIRAAWDKRAAETRLSYEKSEKVKNPTIGNSDFFTKDFNIREANRVEEALRQSSDKSDSAPSHSIKKKNIPDM